MHARLPPSVNCTLVFSLDVDDDAEVDDDALKWISSSLLFSIYILIFLISRNIYAPIGPFFFWFRVLTTCMLVYRGKEIHPPVGPHRKFYATCQYSTLEEAIRVRVCDGCYSGYDVSVEFSRGMMDDG